MAFEKEKLAFAIALASNVPMAMAGQPKLDICHYNASGSQNLITVAVKAANAHFTRHDDTIPEFRYLDADGDGFGDAGVFIETCEEQDGFVEDDTDLDDTDPSITNVEPTAAPPAPPPPTTAAPPIYA